MNTIQQSLILGYEKHSGFSCEELDNQPIASVYKQIEYFLIQKWLRNKYHWNIIVFNDDGDIEHGRLRYNYELRYVTPTFKIKDKKNIVGNYEYKTYEEAMQKAVDVLVELINPNVK